MIVRMVHAALSVRDMETALDFYRSVLGFPVLFRLSDDAGRPKTVYLEVCRGQYLELFYSRAPFGETRRAEPDEIPYGYHHLSFLCSSLREAEERLLAAGVPCRREPDGLFFRDPEGNLLRFREAAANQKRKSSQEDL